MNWDPLHDLVALHERGERRPPGGDGAWTPLVDLLETDAAFLIVAELPGLGSDDFTITATADRLVLAGTRRAAGPTPRRFLRLERGHGRFSRSFAFASPIDVRGVAAHFDAGLLQITVPKASAGGDRRIEVR